MSPDRHRRGIQLNSHIAAAGTPPDTVTGEGAEYFKFQGLRPTLDGIPLALAHVDQWVLWRAAPKPSGAGVNKIPMQPNGRPASSTDPGTWSDFHTVWSAYEEDPETYAGIGFVVTDKDQFVGGDLDHCRNADTGELTPLAARIVSGIHTYWEVTPSGTGLRFFATGDAGRSFKGNGIEVYTSGRYLTVTGYRHGEQNEPLPISQPAVARLRDLATGNQATAPSPGTQADPVVAAIQTAGLYRRQLDQGRHEVLCPWWHAHTDGDQTGTVYMEAHYLGHAAAAFVCQHTSCSDKRLLELRDFLNLPPEAAPAGATPALIEVDLTDLAQATLEPPRYIIKPIIPRGHTTLFGGHGGSGKSLVALTWAAHLAAGAVWGPFEMPPCRVLFVSLEDDGALVRYRLRRIADDYHLDLAQISQRLAVIDASDAEPLAGEASTYGVRALVWSAVAEQIRSRAAGVDLLVLDNASDAFGGDENCRRQVRAFVKGITQMVRGTGGAVLLLAHIDKAAARYGGKGNGYSGSTAWHNTVRSRLALEADEIRHEKLNLGLPLDQPIPIVWSDNGVPRPGVSGIRTPGPQDDADDAAVLACLRAAVLTNVNVPTAEQGPATAWHSLAAFQECPAALKAPEGKPRVRAALLRLLRAGKITKESYTTSHRKAAGRWSPTC